MVDETPPVDPVTASTPPVGVPSTQIFAIAIAVVILYGIAGIAVIWKGDPAERTAWEQSAIGLATMAVGYYLGSSASSRNKDHSGN